MYWLRHIAFIVLSIGVVFLVSGVAVLCLKPTYLFLNPLKKDMSRMSLEERY